MDQSELLDWATTPSKEEEAQPDRDRFKSELLEWASKPEPEDDDVYSRVKRFGQRKVAELQEGATYKRREDEATVRSLGGKLRELGEWASKPGGVQEKAEQAAGYVKEQAKAYRESPEGQAE